MRDYWVAVEDEATCEVAEFEQATARDVLDLMDDYKLDLCSADPVRVRDVEEGQHVMYDGVVYRGGFGYSLWVTHKYREM